MLSLNIVSLHYNLMLTLLSTSSFLFANKVVSIFFLSSRLYSLLLFCGVSSSDWTCRSEVFASLSSVQERPGGSSDRHRQALSC